MKLKLHWQILIALVLAVFAGVISGKEAGIFGISFYAMFAFAGTLFLNALKMIIVPLVVSSVVVGIAGIGSSGALGRLGGKTLLYYLTTSLLAILVGLLMVNILTPGILDGLPAKEVIGQLDDKTVADVLSRVEGKGAGDLAGVFLQLFPPNIIEAASSNGQLLGLIVFSLFMGFFMTRIDEPYAQSFYNFWSGLNQVMMKITDFIILFAPIGVFGLVAKVVADTDTERLDDLARTVGVFFLTVVAALAFHFLVTLPLILKYVARVNPLRHYRAMAPALLTAFSTSSSASTLPLTMECVEENAKVSNRTTSFVLPLGATVNMDGTALYECVAAMFIAQAYGLDLPFTVQFTVVLIALLTSIGVAAIPSASLVAITVILAAIGLPADGIAMIMAVDRILDMLRTAVNVFSDSCGAVVIGKLQGEDNILKD
ncbi:MAG TPA: dicarboxylate/amino acid:cation symporter [Gammaproteobacteria bacterium]|nr:dicarboxylate/amino acid:cation symporter [Gammaproteobacteria bacterium]